MIQFARLLFILLLVVSAALIVTTTGQLPAQVASHFGAGGAANASMSRSGYLVFMLAFAVGLPLFIVLCMAVLPRLGTKGINIPHRDYWMDPARREATFRYIAAHAYWLGSLMTAFIAGIHLLLIEANALRPPQLPLRPFILLMTAFVIGMGVWAVTLMLHFRRRS